MIRRVKDSIVRTFLRGVIFAVEGFVYLASEKLPFVNKYYVTKEHYHLQRLVVGGAIPLGIIPSGEYIIQGCYVPGSHGMGTMFLAASGRVYVTKLTETELAGRNLTIAPEIDGFEPVIGTEELQLLPLKEAVMSVQLSRGRPFVGAMKVRRETGECRAMVWGCLLHDTEYALNLTMIGPGDGDPVDVDIHLSNGIAIITDATHVVLMVNEDVHITIPLDPSAVMHWSRIEARYDPNSQKVMAVILCSTRKDKRNRLVTLCTGLDGYQKGDLGIIKTKKMPIDIAMTDVSLYVMYQDRRVVSRYFESEVHLSLGTACSYLLNAGFDLPKDQRDRRLRCRSDHALRERLMWFMCWSKQASQQDHPISMLSKDIAKLIGDWVISFPLCQAPGPRPLLELK